MPVSLIVSLNKSAYGSQHHWLLVTICSAFLKRVNLYKVHRSENRGVLLLASYPMHCNWPNSSSVRRKRYAPYRIVMPNSDVRDDTKTTKTQYKWAICCIQWGHNFSGPEVGRSHWVHCEKGPAEVVLPSPAKEDQPAKRSCWNSSTPPS